jgi:hypothetical protein
VEWLNLALALLLTVFTGAACIGLLIARQTPARAAIVWGNGALLGLFLTPLVMRLQDAVGLPLSFSVSATGLGILLLILLVFLQLRARSPAVSPGFVAPRMAFSPAQKTLFLLFAMLIGLRVLSLGMELVWRPLYAWDATMHWATKARVWFSAGSLVPFVENQQWLEMGGNGVFTDHHPGYPITVPLLQVWMSSALDRWDESLINLPWLLCLVGLGSAFYGQSRFAGATPVVSIAFTYLLLSMPLLNTHVALAGYADLFMGAAYCLAIMAFYNWSVTRAPGQGLLALLFIFCCMLAKNEGFYWALTFLPALLVVTLPHRHTIVLFCAASLMLVSLLMVIPQDIEVAGHSLQQLDLHYRPNALWAIAVSFWVQDNWHLFAYLLLALSLLSMVPARTIPRPYLGVITALVAAIGLLLVLFTFTHFSNGALRFTAIGRISLHLVPGLLFLCLLLWNNIAATGLSGADAANASLSGAGRPDT